MQPALRNQDLPVGIIFDTSLDGGIDQILALAMLMQLQAARQVRFSSISTGKFSLKNAAFLDAVARFYSGTMAEGYGPSRGLLPVGMSLVGTQTDAAAPMISSALGKVGADGEPAYPHTVTGINDTADAPALIRNALSANQDANAAVVLAGSPVNLLSFLELPDSGLWAPQKARVLSIAAGRFDGGAPDPAIRANIAGFRKLLAEWPTPVVMAGAELNDLLPFPGTSIDKLVGSAPDHPVADAYRAYKPMPYDGPTQAMAAVLHSVSPEENYFTLSESGTISILDDGRTQFTPSLRGRHHYLTVTPDQKERVVQAYVKLLTEPPSNGDEADE